VPELHQHPDMAALGPKTWARLHQWAAEFKAAVGDSCGCGDFAVMGMRAFHDLVNFKLGKPLKHQYDFDRTAQEFHSAVHPGPHTGQAEGAFMASPPPFGWPGGKRLLARHIIALMPPHQTYVEPFVGAGAVFWAKPRSQVEVLSDVNPDLMRFYQGIATMESCDVVGLTRDWDGIKERDGRLTPCEFLAEVNCSFSSDTNGGFTPQRSTCKNGGPFHNHMAEYRQRIEGVHVLKGDWEPVVRKFDSPDTFFYLDPPYTRGWKDYKGGDQDQLTRLGAVLPVLQGKWLLSYDDTPEVRAAFPGYEMRSLETSRKLGPNPENRERASELLIANYPLPKFRAAQPAAMAEGTGIYPFLDPEEYDEDEEETNPDGPTIRHRKGKGKGKKRKVEPMKANNFDEWTLSDFELRDRPWWSKAKEAAYLAALDRAEEKYHREGDERYAEAIRSMPKRKDGESDAELLDRIHIWQSRIREEGRKQRGYSQAEADKAAVPSANFSNAFLDMLLGTAGQAVVATLASTIVARALGGGAVAISGSPQAVLKVIDDRASRCKDTETWDGEMCKPKDVGITGGASVVSPAHVQGDQAQVDVGTLLEEINASLNNPSTMGEIDADTLRVVRG